MKLIAFLLLTLSRIFLGLVDKYIKYSQQWKYKPYRVAPQLPFWKPILIVWEFTGCYRFFGLINFEDILFENLVCNKVYKIKLNILKKTQKPEGNNWKEEEFMSAHKSQKWEFWLYCFWGRVEHHWGACDRSCPSHDWQEAENKTERGLGQDALRNPYFLQLSLPS